MTCTPASRSPCRTVAAIATALSALLSACGGGGDAATPGGAAAASAPAGAAATAIGSTCNLPDFRASVLARINQVRAGGANCGADGVFGAAAAVTWNDKLTVAAEGHSQDMAAKDYFSHTSADGRSPFDRMRAAGYNGRLMGENIAAGYRTAAAVMQGWMNSAGHRANILNCGFREIGIGHATGGSYGMYWTQDFGTK